MESCLCACECDKYDENIADNLAITWKDET